VFHRAPARQQCRLAQVRVAGPGVAPAGARATKGPRWPPFPGLHADACLAVARGAMPRAGRRLPRARTAAAAHGQPPAAQLLRHGSAWLERGAASAPVHMRAMMWVLAPASTPCKHRPLLGRARSAILKKTSSKITI
jgi:hypothetical protein